MLSPLGGTGDRLSRQICTGLANSRNTDGTYDSKPDVSSESAVIQTPSTCPRNDPSSLDNQGALIALTRTSRCVESRQHFWDLVRPSYSGTCQLNMNVIAFGVHSGRLDPYNLPPSKPSRNALIPTPWPVGVAERDGPAFLEAERRSPIDPAPTRYSVARAALLPGTSPSHHSAVNPHAYSRTPRERRQGWTDGVRWRERCLRTAITPARLRHSRSRFGKRLTGKMSTVADRC